jgi:hydrogenase maturation factor HypE
MIGSVIGKEMDLNDFVRRMIQGTKDKSIKKKLEDAILSANDVVGLKEIREILEPFLFATRRLEGIPRVLLAMLMKKVMVPNGISAQLATFS